MTAVLFVTIRLDYANVVRASLPGYFLQQLLSLTNAAARLIHDVRRSDHSADALINLR